MTVIFALTAVKATIGLIAIFLVLFPALAQGLIMFAAAQAMGEREENERFLSGHGDE